MENLNASIQMYSLEYKRFLQKPRKASLVRLRALSMEIKRGATELRKEALGLQMPQTAKVVQYQEPNVSEDSEGTSDIEELELVREAPVKAKRGRKVKA